MEYERAGGFEHKVAEVVGDQRLAVFVHFHDGVGGTDHPLGKRFAVGNRPRG